jgi:hypothetical protein
VFDDAPPIIMIMKGWLKPLKRGESVTEDMAWSICRKAVETGKRLEFEPVPLDVDV